MVEKNYPVICGVAGRGEGGSLMLAGRAPRRRGKLSELAGMGGICGFVGDWLDGVDADGYARGMGSMGKRGGGVNYLCTLCFWVRESGGLELWL